MVGALLFKMQLLFDLPRATSCHSLPNAKDMRGVAAPGFFQAFDTAMTRSSPEPKSGACLGPKHLWDLPTVDFLMQYFAQRPSDWGSCLAMLKPRTSELGTYPLC